MIFSILYHTNRSHVFYQLNSYDANFLELKISRLAQKVLCPQTPGKYDQHSKWDHVLFEQFLLDLVRSKYLTVEDVPSELHPDLREEIAQIERKEGDWKEAVIELKEILSTKDHEELQAIENKRIEALQNLQELEEQRSESQEKICQIKEQIEASQSSYEYLTEGPGQYEEYESYPSEEMQEWQEYYVACQTMIQPLLKRIKKSEFARAYILKKLVGISAKLDELNGFIKTLLVNEKVRFAADEIAILNKISQLYKNLRIDLKWTHIMILSADRFVKYNVPLADSLLDPEYQILKRDVAFLYSTRSCDELDIQKMSTAQKKEIFFQYKKITKALKKQKSPHYEGADFWRFVLEEQESDVHIELGHLLRWVENLAREHKNAALFSAQLERKEIYTTLSDEDKEGLFTNFCSLFEELTGIDFDADIDEARCYELFEELWDVANEISVCLEDRLNSSEFDLRYDEWSYGAQHVEGVLEHAVANMEDVKESVLFLHEAVIEFIQVQSQLKDLNELYFQRNTAYEEANQRLTKLLKKIKEEKVKEFAQSEEKKQLSLKEQSLLDSVIWLFRKEQLKIERKDNNRESIKKEIAGLDEKIKRSQGDVIDLAIEWVRLNRQLMKIEGELAAQQREVASSFKGVMSFENNSCPAFASIKQKEGPAKVLGVRAINLHPFNSPLAHMVSVAAQRGVSNINGFVAIPYRELTLFEKGVCSVVFPKAENKIVPLSLLSLQQNENTHSERLNIDYQDNIYPDYYDKFVWENPNLQGVLSLQIALPESFYSIYTLVAVKIALLFLNPHKRESLQIPEGLLVGCLIVSKVGEILSWAVNTNSKDGMRHAEVNAIGAYFKKHPDQITLPEGAILFTSLKSCHMCSGAISDFIKPQKELKQVIYAQTDPKQQNTTLVGLEQQLNIELTKTIDEIYNRLKIENKAINAAMSFSHKKFAYLPKELDRQLIQSLQSSAEHEVLVQQVNLFITYLENL